MDGALSGIVTVATAIVGVAILSVLVSKNSQTPKVIQAAGTAFGNALVAAEGPVSSSAPGYQSWGLGF